MEIDSIGLHLPSHKMGGQGRKPIIPHVSPKRYRKRCREPRPLPLGEVAPKVTERASPAGKSRCAAIGRLFVRAILSLCQSCLAASLPSQSGLRPPRPGCGSQRLLRCRSHPAGRGPNSSSLFPPLAAVVAVAPKGEPLACRSAFVWTSEAQYLGSSSAPLSEPATA